MAHRNVLSKYTEERITGQIILRNRSKDENSSHEIYVKNLPKEIDLENLVLYFERAGNITQIRLMTDPDNLQTRGYCYVQFTSKNEADLSLSLKPISTWSGVHPEVEISLNNCRIFIGGLPVNKKKDQIWQELKNQGMTNIVDVIVYRSYTNRANNRGFVFVEFATHKEAAKVRAKFKHLKLWDRNCIVDWSIPMENVDDDVMSKVKIVFLRNLPVVTDREDLKKMLEKYVPMNSIEKIYKFKNYAFIHLSTRTSAEKLKSALEDHYKETDVEVSWAKPPTKYTKPDYKERKMRQLSQSSNTSKSSHSSGEGSSSTQWPSSPTRSSISEAPSYENYSQASSQRDANSVSPRISSPGAKIKPPKIACSCEMFHRLPLVDFSRSKKEHDISTMTFDEENDPIVQGILRILEEKD